MRALAWAAVLLVAAPAAAQPLRLRADALADTRSPVGLLVLDADGELEDDGLSAEALVWLGAETGGVDERGALHADGDALVIAVRARTRGGRAEARIGRVVVTAGALRPMHLDGVAGRVRLPRRVDVEAFAGIPVAFAGAAAWDWAVGGRIGRRLGDWGGAGVAVIERREAGRLAVREVGLDAGGMLGRHDLAARVALDTLDEGAPAIALADASFATRRGAVRAEVYARARAPSHLLPATSLFTVLGDVPSRQGGLRATWRAAPRLDLTADVGARIVDGAVGEELAARATLRLDDRGRGAIACELHRTEAMEAGWTGARATARVPIADGWTASTELELVLPDDAGDRGALWPWALGAVAWRRGAWDAAAGVEASASPEHRSRVDVLLRVGRAWGMM